MTAVLADVGGTNTRLAVLDADGVVSHIRRYANDEFADFAKVLTRYRADTDLADVSRCGVAVAGPVTGDVARLTNRDWQLSRTDLAQTCAIPTEHVFLMNDLAALALSLPELEEDQLDALGGAAKDHNGQALVAGFGTGFNVALSKETGPGHVVIECELGHAGAPASFASFLPEPLHGMLDSFETLLSGRGLSAIHAHLTGAVPRDGREIPPDFDSDQAAAEAVTIFAHLMVASVRQLVMTYRPLAGLFLAGGVARGVLASPARSVFLDSLRRLRKEPEMSAGCGPVFLITDDAAALKGVAQGIGRATV